jgi:multidrug efflux pump subunit AcrB
MIYALYLMRIPVRVKELIGLLVVVAAMANGGVLLLVLAEELRIQEGLTPFEAVRKPAEIRLWPPVMISLSVIVGFIPLALNLEEDAATCIRPWRP